MARLLPLLLLVALAACQRAPEAPAESPAVTRRCVPVTAGPLARSVLVRGVVEIAPGYHALVAARASGQVVALLVHEGQAVERGQVLAEVDARQAADSAALARSTLAAAQAGSENARVSAERAARLLDAGIASRQEVDDALARLRAAEAAVEGARSSLEVAQRAVSFATIRAPLPGLVLRTLRGPGDLVDGTPATPIVDVGDPSHLDLLVNVSPAELIQLALGQRGVARFDALPGRSWAVEVQTLAPMLDATTGLGVARLGFTDAGVSPPIGLPGEARVEVGQVARALTAPDTALRGSPSGGFEVLRCEAGRARVTAVEVGARQDGRAEIVSGLREGVRVVEADVLGLDDGTALEEAR
jgi:multidrug efflux system membrane fusion protein